VLIVLGEGSVGAKTETHSNDITEHPHDDWSSIGMFVFLMTDSLQSVYCTCFSSFPGADNLFLS